jgi:hypothetical protein
MGAYEVFKTAQVELANTVAAELENTGVYAFTIGPGISMTRGFIEGGGKVASLMGMSLKQLFELNKNAQITPEEAGAGFATAVAFAKKYHGQEISSIQVLREAGIPMANQEQTELVEQKSNQPPTAQSAVSGENMDTDGLYRAVVKTYIEQSGAWKSRNLFERQWISRDFKKTTGMSIDEMQATLKNLGITLKNGTSTTDFAEPLNKLVDYFEHQKDLLKGFEKIDKKQKENALVIDGWITEVKALLQALSA